MHPRSGKTKMVAFKVDREMAATLGALPGMSEFIRSAIKKQLAMACPLCQGTGMAPHPRDALGRLVERHPVRVCSRCGRHELQACSEMRPDDEHRKPASGYVCLVCRPPRRPSLISGG